MEKNGLQQGGERICSCCGAKMKLHYHRLNKGLVNVLIKFRKQVLAKNHNQIQISELNLTTTEFCNFQKLRYHAMIAKCKDSEGKRMGGYWLLTKRGNEFCKGLIEVPEKVGTFRNKIRKKSKEFVSIGKVLNNELPVWDSVETMDFEMYVDSDIEESLWDDPIVEQSGQSKLRI